MIETTSSDPLQYTPENYHDNGKNNHLKIYLLFNRVIPIQHGDFPILPWEGKSLSNTLSTSITSSLTGPVQPDLPIWQPLVHAWLSLKKKIGLWWLPSRERSRIPPCEKETHLQKCLGKRKVLHLGIDIVVLRILVDQQDMMYGGHTYSYILVN